MFILVSGRLQVVVHCIGGAGRCCGNCVEFEMKEKKTLSDASHCCCTLSFGRAVSAHTNTQVQKGLIGLVRAQERKNIR